eukprot:gene3173-13187_t
MPSSRRESAVYPVGTAPRAAMAAEGEPPYQITQDVPDILKTDLASVMRQDKAELIPHGQVPSPNEDGGNLRLRFVKV